MCVCVCVCVCVFVCVWGGGVTIWGRAAAQTQCVRWPVAPLLAPVGACWGAGGLLALSVPAAAARHPHPPAPPFLLVVDVFEVQRDASSPRDVHFRVCCSKVRWSLRGADSRCWDPLPWQPELAVRIGIHTIPRPSEPSQGTYIRSLAHDLGHALGSAAHLTALRREANGEHRVDEAWRMDDLLARIAERQPQGKEVGDAAMLSAGQ